LKKTIETITMVTAAKKFCAEYKAQWKQHTTIT
jgi:hypothetical protein